MLTAKLLPLLALAGRAAACTTVAVGKAATVDGSVMCSHTNDGEGMSDPRMIRIPASEWPTGTMRKVFFNPEDYPRYVGTDRATTAVPEYLPQNQIGGYMAPFEPMPGCEIPQVPHTYQYYEDAYGAHNEKQLGIAESTCSGIFGAAPRGQNVTADGKIVVGKACWSIDSLSQIAMERHSRARDAIRDIGRLAEQTGFYGAGLFEGGAESLLITDVDEAWIFHILPSEPADGEEYSSAIWAAQRIPDDSYAAVTNAFIIRDIDRDSDPDTGDFLFSESVFTTARRHRWWSEESGEPLDFTATFSDGEYANKYYSGRRLWGVFNYFSPSLNVPAEYLEYRYSKPYPVTAKPDALISVADIAAVNRLYYIGTNYSQAGSGYSADMPDEGGAPPSLRAGVELGYPGGPWGSPDHVAGNNNTAMPSGANQYGIAGNWERTIGLYRTSESYISQSRKNLPDECGGVLWYGPYSATYTVYTPFAAGMKELPPQVTNGTHMQLDKDTMFWANRYVGNYVQLKWWAMIEDVRAFQNEQMQHHLALQARVDTACGRRPLFSSMPSDDPLHAYYTNAERVTRETWNLADHLMFKYADGQLHPTDTRFGTLTPPRAYGSFGDTVPGSVSVIDKPGYDGAWLETVGFPEGPPPPPNCTELAQRYNRPICGHVAPPNGPFREWLQLKEFAVVTGLACAYKGDAAAATNNCH
ncbi:hypothetical protein EMIHUDRAFT_470725 [Emiliania huxleyi CCMP1516]|uniref:Dipeptidase n=2 Tax=Emiliania huxleyi TaxID=2903 RepID=A0A0D3IQ51_EMIH1|nr:hypothetical protein EMIHUDRAFT_470725 [Emiliania huxleyi CCMP1516]EOD13386.1 hypothetical protein EMIHUDRAFT_470725 [Emiliania huxleyi CCMP1516]|eukprot:XP_005765815.1 hypothetical protein EMIHUDRAFT_470725 [Emiliania huxleyi CCMP1516]